MPKKTVVITGVKALDRRLKNIDAKLGKKFVRQGVRRALKPVQLAAKQFAPDDTGALERSIKIRALKRSRRRFGARVSSDGSRIEGQYYGGFQEWGTRYVTGQLFMHNAARVKRRQAANIFRRYVGRQIVAEARK